MIQSIAHDSGHLGITEGTVGPELSPKKSVKGMLTHPYAKPEAPAAKDCTHVLSEPCVPNESAEIDCGREAAGGKSVSEARCARTLEAAEEVAAGAADRSTV